MAEFDPLTEPLPPDSTGLILPGGFPEQYLETLSANTELREQVCRLAERAPVHAECGGLAYLMDELDGHPMCGVLGRIARFTPRLTLGYRDAVAIADSPLFTTGQRVVGHEFHRTAVEFSGDREPAWVFHGSDGATVRDGALRAGVHASYLHTHPAAHPHSVARFVRCAGQSLNSAGDRERLPRRAATDRQEGRRGRRGTVAQRRVPLLIANGADVHVITRAATPAVEAFGEQQPGITLSLRDYRDGDLEGAWYAIAATDDPAVNAAIVAEAERRQIFCVRADAARGGTAVTPPPSSTTACSSACWPAASIAGRRPSARPSGRRSSRAASPRTSPVPPTR